MDYTGEKCPVCNNVFTSDDDIVVCPDCGTPHHRACYAIENKCANIGLHATGTKWRRNVESRPMYRICPVCRFPNRPLDVSCQRCGTDLREIVPDAPDSGQGSQRDSWREDLSSAVNDDVIDPIKYLGYDPEEDMGGATMQEISDFVGTNTIYYVPKFKRMKDEGPRPSINILGFIFPSLFFANRKMWGWAILAAFLGVILNFPSDLLLYVEDYVGQLPKDLADFLSGNIRTLRAVSDIGVAVDLGARALCCFFANWLYFRFALRNLKKRRKNGLPPSGIKRVGGVKPLNMLFIVLIKYGIMIFVTAAFYLGFEMLTVMNDFSTL